MSLRSRCALLLAAFALSIVASLMAAGGCKPSGPGLTDKPPPVGGPKASSRRPPGAMNNPYTR